jgi:mediator of RNA polymerase II transcription subunit 17
MSGSLAANLRPGVLTYDKWVMPSADQRKQEHDALVASGWAMESLTTSADSLLKAATRLEEDVERETQYWGRMLSLHTKGWPVFRVPGEQRTIAVQFSATEAGPLFRDRGIAALRTNKDGSIKLDQRLAMRPKTLRVRYAQKGVVCGTSSVSSVANLPELDVSLENMVHRAQDSLFDEELYHEMALESRILQPLGVKLRGNVIHIPTSPTLDTESICEWLVDLIPVEDLPDEGKLKDDKSQSVVTLLRLHLSHLYRQRLLRRSRVPPPLADSRPPEPPASIIRPLMAIWQHYNAYVPFRSYLSRVIQTLRAAGFMVEFAMPHMAAIEDIVTTLHSSKKATTTDLAVHALIERLSKPMHTTVSLSLPSAKPGSSRNEKLSLRLSTNLSAPVFGTEYTLQLSAGDPLDIGSSTTHSQKSQHVFSSLDELQSYTNNLLAFDIIRNMLVTQHTDWESAQRKPEISKIVETQGKQARTIIGISFENGGIEVYRKWASEGRILQNVFWDEANDKDGLVDVVEGWMKQFQT